MIICYQGTPGSGKSYDAVIKIIANLRKGRVVYTNIDGLGDPVRREFIMKKAGLTEMQLDMQLFHWNGNLPVDVQKIESFTKYVEPRSLVVIDEIHKYFNARDWQSEKNKIFCDWGSTHRHHGFDMLMLTQDYEKVDKQVRSLIEYTYEYKKINFMGSKVNNKYITYSYSGEPTGKWITKSYGTYDKSIFHCYDSYVTRDMKELPVQKHANIFKHPVFYAIPVLILIFVMLFFKSGFSKGEIIPGSAKALELTKKTGNKSAVVSSVSGDKKPIGNVQVVEFKDLQNNNFKLPVEKNNFVPASFSPVKSKSGIRTIEDAEALCDFQGFVKNDDTEYRYYQCGDKQVIFHDGVLSFSFVRDKSVALPVSNHVSDIQPKTSSYPIVQKAPITSLPTSISQSSIQSPVGLNPAIQRNSSVKPLPRR